VPADDYEVEFHRPGGQHPIRALLPPDWIEAADDANVPQPVCPN
jgi:hypothetical protein